MGRLSHSHTALELLHLFSNGDLSAANLQRLANAIDNDGWGSECELMDRFARSGSYGMYSGNVLRDILSATRAAGLTASVCKPYVFAAGKNKHPVEVFLPHEIVAMLSLNSGDPASLCLDEEALNSDEGLGPLLKAWGEVVGIEDDVATCPVIGMHCDGVTYGASLRAGHQKSIISASLNIASARDKSLRHHRHPLYVVHKDNLCSCGCGGFCTYQDIHEVLAWSFRCLREGVTPTKRHDGSDFTTQESRILPMLETPKGALLQIRGDWAWLMEAFRIRSPSSNSFCWMCPAAKCPHLSCGFSKSCAPTLLFDLRVCVFARPPKGSERPNPQ